MDVEAAARRWAATWSRAWPEADVESLALLYAPEAVFYSHPFRERQGPREYVEWAFADQAEAECRFGEPVASGDRAAVDWVGIITSPDGSVETVARNVPPALQLRGPRHRATRRLVGRAWAPRDSGLGCALGPGLASDA